MDQGILNLIKDTVAQTVGKTQVRTSIITLFISIPMIVLASYLGAYLKRRGENLATKNDFDQLKSQLEENTRITNSIEKHYTKEYTIWQSRLEFKRKQIEEFYGPIYALLSTTYKMEKLWNRKDKPLKEIDHRVLEMFNLSYTRIISVITTKAHLIEGGIMPKAVINYIHTITLYIFFTQTTPDHMVPKHIENDPAYNEGWGPFWLYIRDTYIQLTNEIKEYSIYMDDFSPKHSRI